MPSVSGVDADGVLRISRSCAIATDELEWRFTASGGPGGQHANTSNTKVEVRFDVAVVAVARARGSGRGSSNGSGPSCG